MKNILAKYDVDNDFINRVLTSFSEQSDSIEWELEAKLDYIYAQKESSDDGDVSDL